MRTIELNAANWKSALDFYDAVLSEIGAFAGHGRNLNALIESMIWLPLEKVKAPYVIRVRGTKNAPDDVRKEVALVKHHLIESRAAFQKMEGQDPNVSIEIES